MSFFLRFHSPSLASISRDENNRPSLSVLQAAMNSAITIQTNYDGRSTWEDDLPKLESLNRNTTQLDHLVPSVTWTSSDLFWTFIARHEELLAPDPAQISRSAPVFPLHIVNNYWYKLTFFSYKSKCIHFNWRRNGKEMNKGMFISYGSSFPVPRLKLVKPRLFLVHNCFVSIQFFPASWFFLIFR